MYRIIIVDDENLERKLFSNIIDWNQYGFELVASFNNGEDALSYIDNNKVDVVISDIVMPGVNGIELVTEISRLYPDILNVFISAYADFSYAQKAISLKVIDYILKPISPGKVEECCLKLKKLLDEKMLPESESINFKTLYSQQALYEYYASDNDLETFSSMLEECDIHIDNDKCFGATVQISISDFADYLQTRWKYGTDLAYNAIFNLIGKEKFDFIPINYSYNIINILLLSSKHDYESFEKFVHSFAVSFPETANEILSVELSIKVISVTPNLADELENIKNSFSLPSKNTINNTGDTGVINMAVAYINENFNKDITLDKVAETVYLTPFHFSKLFKKQIGENYIDYLNRIRLEKAHELLVNTNMKIHDIYTSVGYNSKSHFYKMFKFYYGSTPLEYRNNTWSKNNKEQE